MVDILFKMKFLKNVNTLIVNASSLMPFARKSMFNLVPSNVRHRCLCVMGLTADTSLQPSSSTIYSLSSGQGKAGVAVIRISGPNASKVLFAIARLKALPMARTAILRCLVNPSNGELLDKGLVLWFPGPASFTGEDCCELHVHGGLAVISAVLASLSKLNDFRQAMPGEFTRRSFINGKLDLTAVEGIADLIHAETEAQRIQALRQADGELHRLYFNWRTRILKALAHVEAFIDFSEDENIEEGVMDTVENEVQRLHMELRNHLTDERRGERLRGGVHAVIVGSPNTGKSSLLNIICQRPAAIVSSVAGTTRDVVDCAVNIGGYPLLISDTAGLRESQDFVEKEGIKRALDRARQADLVVVMMDSTKISLQSTNHSNDITEQITTYMSALQLETFCNKVANISAVTSTSQRDQEFKNILVVLNKTDLIHSSVDVRSDFFDMSPLSCISLQGVDLFIEKLKGKVEKMCSTVTAEVPHLTQARHREHLSRCAKHLENYLQRQSTDVVLAAHELRKSTRELGKISGDITTEDVLDVIFKEFCIGK